MLDTLPESLDSTYERVLREIKKPNREYALRLLQCLVVATRPLWVDELAEVLAVNFDVEDGIPTLNTSWRWEDQEQALLSSCSSLISIIRGDRNYNSIDTPRGVVQFSHFSVKEFLTSPRLAAPIREVSHYYIGLEPAHTIMAQACLSVLLRSDDRVEHDGTKNNSPLASYAAEYWVTHAQFKDVSSTLRRPMECLFDVDRPYFASWLKLHDIDTPLPEESPFYAISFISREPPTGPIYYAALCGFRDLAEHLIVKHPQGMNAGGGYYVTPCVAALAGRHFELAHLLSCNGSSVNTRGNFENSPLHAACHRGDLEMIRILLEYGADINAQNEFGATPLLWVAESGSSEGVCVLLEQGANPNISRHNGATPLHYAVQSGSAAKVRLLLDHDAGVDAVNGEGKTALSLAREGGHEDIVTLLLAHGANVSC